VETIEHGDNGTPEIFKLMADRGVCFVPTVAAGDAIQQYRGYKHSDPDPPSIRQKKTSFKAAMDIYGELNGSNPAWKKIYADLAQDFGSGQAKVDWSPVEHEMLGVIDIEKLLAVERATVEKGQS